MEVPFWIINDLPVGNIECSCFWNESESLSKQTVRLKFLTQHKNCMRNAFNGVANQFRLKLELCSLLEANILYSRCGNSRLSILEFDTPLRSEKREGSFERKFTLHMPALIRIDCSTKL